MSTPTPHHDNNRDQHDDRAPQDAEGRPQDPQPDAEGRPQDQGAEGRVIDLAARLRGTGGTAGAPGWGEFVPLAKTTPAPVPAQPLDADPEDLVGAPVDPPASAYKAQARAGGRRPVLPVWLRSREALVNYATAYGREAAHVTAFHGLRLPVYWARLAGRSPIGAWRLTAGACRWAWDPDSAAMRTALAKAGPGGNQSVSFYRLGEQRREVVKARTTTLAVTAVCLFLAVGVLVMQPWPIVAVSVLIALSALGWFGRSADAPIVSGSAVAAMSVPRLTSELILTALGSLGIAELNKHLRSSGPDALRFVAPITRDGHGWRADIDLPPGVTAGHVMDKRAQLASGLRRPAACVWPEADIRQHEGRLVLWVADKPLSEQKPAPWPLTTKGSVDLFQPVPLGVDQRGRPVNVTLMFASGLVASIPRMGKSFTLRLLTVAASLDPRCQLAVFDFKGGSDFVPLQPVAHAWRAGSRDSDLEYVLAYLRTAKADMDRRYETIQRLPLDVCPEGRVTTELASKKALGLHPVWISLDECQIAFEHPTYGAEIEALACDLSKRGPAAGIMCWLATQRPDAQSIPKSVSDNVVIRVCLKVIGHAANDMVLGSGMYSAGIRATTLNRSDKGLAWLAGEGDDPIIVRAAYIDAVTARTITARARAARITAGRLDGYAADQDQAPEPEQDEAALLDHLAAVWPVGKTRAQFEALAPALAERWPARYEAWTAVELGAAARALGLPTVQVKDTATGSNRRGLTRDDLHQAITQRNRDEGGDPGE